MIRIRRITNLDRLAETVPKPKGAVPKFGLPGWRVMPLGQKIPMIPGPVGTYNFTRRKVGRKLWATSKSKMEFDLSDPYRREIGFPYEPLHDEHLFDFFNRPANLKSILKTDLITADMDVKCSLHDYNAYRKYLRKIHADRIKRELRRRNRLFVERRALCFAEEQACKEVKRLKEREKFASKRQHFVEQQRLQEKLRIWKQKEKARQTARRLKLLRFIKQEERRLLNIKSKERAERTRQKCMIKNMIVRRKVIDVLADWKNKDKARKKANDKRLMEIEQQKRQNLEEKWRRKQCFQEKNIAKQKMLLQRIETRREKFIKDYNEKIKKETARMQRLLDNMKLFTNCYIKRHLPDGRERICCKKYFYNKTDEKREVKNNPQNPTHLSPKIKKKIKDELNPNDKRQNARQKGKYIAKTNHNNKIEEHTMVGKQKSLTENEKKEYQPIATNARVVPIASNAFNTSLVM